jgi:hypothetical protein
MQVRRVPCTPTLAMCPQGRINVVVRSYVAATPDGLHFEVGFEARELSHDLECVQATVVQRPLRPSVFIAGRGRRDTTAGRRLVSWRRGCSFTSASERLRARE